MSLSPRPGTVPDETAQRSAAWLVLLDLFGRAARDETVAILVNATREVPLPVFRAAMQRLARETERLSNPLPPFFACVAVEQRAARERAAEQARAEREREQEPRASPEQVRAIIERLASAKSLPAPAPAAAKAPRLSPSVLALARELRARISEETGGFEKNEGGPLK